MSSWWGRHDTVRSQPTLGAVGLSYWAGQYCLRSIAEAARQSDLLSATNSERTDIHACHDQALHQSWSSPTHRTVMRRHAGICKGGADGLFCACDSQEHQRHPIGRWRPQESRTRGRRTA